MIETSGIRLVIIAALTACAISAATAAKAQSSPQCEEEWENPLDTTAGTEPLSRMGESAGIDGNWAIVGAPKSDQLENGTALNVGVAFIYERDVSQGQLPGARWTLRRTMQITSPFVPTFNNFFGQSVAISGTRVIAGAPQVDDNGFTATGAASIWRDNGTTWIPEKILTVPSTPGQSTGDLFGTSVDIDDPTGWAVVGATEGNSSGSAYVYERVNSWAGFELTSTTAVAPGDAFGKSVAISGDTVVVGASFADHSSLSNPGAVWVFVRSGASWSEQAYLTASVPNQDDQFGCSVDIDGDTIVVGACQFNLPGKSAAGSMYVFDRNGTTWTQSAQLDAGVRAEADDKLGGSVSISGDTLIAGAVGTPMVTGSGEEAYIFTRTAGTWSAVGSPVSSGHGSEPKEFGCSVAISGASAVVCAPGADTTAIGGWADSGAGYFFAPFDDTHEFYGTAEATGQDCQGPGSGSELEVTGLPSVTSTSPFYIVAEDATVVPTVNNKCTVRGFLIWTIAGRANQAYGQGTILVQDWKRITPVQWEVYPQTCTVSTPPANPCAAGFSIGIDFNQFIQATPADPALFAGQRINAQWILDNIYEIGDNVKETTDAVEFIICP